MREKPQSNDALRLAFPSKLHTDALAAISVLPPNPYWFNCFAVKVDGETVSIPRRIYHDTSHSSRAKLDNLQNELLDCILTRHCDGFIRERHLTRIVTLRKPWIAPFVVQLLGEYVIEIIRIIDQNQAVLDTASFEQFFRNNPDFLILTEQRVFSYWDCYYRSIEKTDYAGFRVLKLFKRLATSAK